MTTVADAVTPYLKRPRRSGNENLAAICPFHRKSDGTEERNPSFNIHLYSGLWVCFSCHARGNLYTFLRDVGIPRSQMDFQYKGLLEEVRKYAPTPNEPKPAAQIYGGEDLPEALLGLFDGFDNLLTSEGFPDPLARQFDIGYDAKHSRITFPLRDVQGRLVGISGRAVYKEQQPRYKVYDKEYLDFGLPERQTFKAQLLWNMHMVYAEMAQTMPRGPHDRMARAIVVTEGFKATMRMVQAGVTQTVGAVGSYLSDEQIWLLHEVCSSVYLMFDNNFAGMRGRLAIGRKLVEKIPSLYVVQYSAEQPSDLTPEAAADAVADAISWQSWLLQQSFTDLF